MRRPCKLEELERMRRVAARMFELGRPNTEIAFALERDAQTVRAWKRAWRAGGVEALKARKHPGPRPKMNDEQWQELIGLLGEGPRAHGFDAYLWTTTLIAELIRQRFDVSYHHDYVGEVLHRLGWSPQRPAKVARERDEAAIKNWREVEWPALLKKVKTTVP